MLTTTDTMRFLTYFDIFLTCAYVVYVVTYIPILQCTQCPSEKHSLDHASIRYKCFVCTMCTAIVYYFCFAFVVVVVVVVVYVLYQTLQGILTLLLP